MMKRIGVLGGSFNPIHLGHLHIAEEIRKLFSLSRVYFVVATVPPHKAPGAVIPFLHRYAMVSLATAGSPLFVPSMVELEPEASPFSIDTMRKLVRCTRREEGELYFIAGGDSLAEVKTWRESEKLLSSYNFIFVSRPGSGNANPATFLPGRTADLAEDLRNAGPSVVRRSLKGQGRGNRIYIVDVDAPDISATRIRRLARDGKSIQRMVPAPVSGYIRKLHLYGGR